MSISALGAGLSGLYANQQALDVEGNNVANMASQNFSAQKAVFAEAGPAGSGVTLSAKGRTLAAAEGGTDLAASMTNSMLYKASFQMAAKVIQMADQRIGTLIDITA